MKTLQLMFWPTHFEVILTTLHWIRKHWTREYHNVCVITLTIEHGTLVGFVSVDTLEADSAHNDKLLSTLTSSAIIVSCEDWPINVTILMKFYTALYQCQMKALVLTSPLLPNHNVELHLIHLQFPTSYQVVGAPVNLLLILFIKMNIRFF